MDRSGESGGLAPARNPPCLCGEMADYAEPVIGPRFARTRWLIRLTRYALLNPGRMFWLWWNTLSGSYMVFTSTSRS